MDHETSAKLKELGKVVQARLKAVYDWKPIIKLACDGLSASQLSNFRQENPVTKDLSDHQIRRLVYLKASGLGRLLDSPMPSPASQQPHRQADVADRESSDDDYHDAMERLSQVQPSDFLHGTHASDSDKEWLFSALSREPSTPPSLSTLGQVSESSDEISSPGNNGPRSPQPAGPPATLPQTMTPISPANRGTPASYFTSSMLTPQRGPQSPLPTQAAPRCIAATQGMPFQGLQDAREKRPQQHLATQPCPKRQRTNSAQTATEAPRVPLPSQHEQLDAEQQQPPSAQGVPIHMAPSLLQPAQHSAHPDAQQQQPLNCQPVPARGVSIYLSGAERFTQPISITVTAGQDSSPVSFKGIFGVSGSETRLQIGPGVYSD